VGGFVLLGIGQVSGHPLTDGYLTLVTLLMGNVSGWYFGTHATLSGAKSAQETASAATAAANAAPAHDPATSR
jgi:hypothetical protein